MNGEPAAAARTCKTDRVDVLTLDAVQRAGGRVGSGWRTGAGYTNENCTRDSVFRAHQPSVYYSGLRIVPKNEIAAPQHTMKEVVSSLKLPYS
jgi:hypothetical protein